MVGGVKFKKRGASLNITIEKLKSRDFKELFEFEMKNRVFFEKFVPARGEDYFNYPTFVVRNDELLKNQEEGKDYFFLIRNDARELLGRINLTDVDYQKKMAYVGYRIGESELGKGIATRSVNQLIQFAIDIGLRELFAQTTDQNVGSQEVLRKTGFIIIDGLADSVSLNGEVLQFLSFQKLLS